MGFLWVPLGPRHPCADPSIALQLCGQELGRVQQCGGAEWDGEGWSTRGRRCGHWAGSRLGHRSWEGGRGGLWCVSGLVTGPNGSCSVWLCTQRDSLASVGGAPDPFFVSKGQCGGPGAVCALVSSGLCQEGVWRPLWPAWL